MTTVFTILFASTLFTTPAATLESDKNSTISYVCYVEEGNLLLTKVTKEQSGLSFETVDTGISTNNIEKVTMALQNNDICVTVSYMTTESVQAYFNSTTLDFNQISLSEPTVFAENLTIAE